MKINAYYTLDLSSVNSSDMKDADISRATAYRSIQDGLLKQIHDTLLSAKVEPDQIKQELKKILSTPAVFTVMHSDNLDETVKNSKEAGAQHLQMVIHVDDEKSVCASLDDGMGFPQQMINKDKQPHYQGFADYRNVVYPGFDKSDLSSFDRYNDGISKRTSISSTKAIQKLQDASISGGRGSGIALPTKILHKFNGSINIGHLDTILQAQEMLTLLGMTKDTVLQLNRGENYRGAVIIRESPLYQNQLNALLGTRRAATLNRSIDAYTKYLQFGVDQMIDMYFSNLIGQIHEDKESASEDLFSRFNDVTLTSGGRQTGPSPSFNQSTSARSNLSISIADDDQDEDMSGISFDSSKITSPTSQTPQEESVSSNLSNLQVKSDDEDSQIRNVEANKFSLYSPNKTVKEGESKADETIKFPSRKGPSPTGSGK